MRQIIMIPTGSLGVTMPDVGIYVKSMGLDRRFSRPLPEVATAAHGS